jgi:hypothetical protein
VTVLPYKLGLLLEDPVRLREMARRARAAGRPQAAVEIARIVAEGQGEPIILTFAETRKLRKAATEV